MSHRVNETQAEKRRTLIALSASSIAVIVILWICYLNYTVVSPDYAENAGPSAGTVFMTGLATIGNTIATGLANSYVYFHDTVTEPATFEIIPK